MFEFNNIFLSRSWGTRSIRWADWVCGCEGQWVILLFFSTWLLRN